MFFLMYPLQGTYQGFVWKLTRLKKYRKRLNGKLLRDILFLWKKNLHLVKFVVFAINFFIFKRAIVNWLKSTQVFRNYLWKILFKVLKFNTPASTSLCVFYVFFICRPWDYLKNFGIPSQFDIKIKTCFFFPFLNRYVSWIERNKILISQLSPQKCIYFAEKNEPKEEPYENKFWQF